MILPTELQETKLSGFFSCRSRPPAYVLPRYALHVAPHMLSRYMLSTIALPNSEHFSLIAPSI